MPRQSCTRGRCWVLAVGGNNQQWHAAVSLHQLCAPHNAYMQYLFICIHWQHGMRITAKLIYFNVPSITFALLTLAASSSRRHVHRCSRSGGGGGGGGDWGRARRGESRQHMPQVLLPACGMAR